MSDGVEVLISVRGQARTSVQPDSAVLRCRIRVRRPSRPAALQAAAEAVSTLTDALAERGGVALTKDTQRHPLTWSTRSISTYREKREPRPEEPAPPRRFRSVVDLSVTVRDFDQLATLAPLIGGQRSLDLSHVSWHVDDDNPAWPDVRADAIHAALAKARDYAAALSGTVTRVDQIADPGLLGDAGLLGAHEMSAQRAASRAYGGAHDVGDSPSLDPVPIDLVAAIDARVVATVPASTPPPAR